MDLPDAVLEWQCVMSRRPWAYIPARGVQPGIMWQKEFIDH